MGTAVKIPDEKIEEQKYLQNFVKIL